jgi:phenylalanyl-tRNA synthetase beta chain
MIFSYKLLSTLVDLSGETPESLRQRLTFSGFEVEGMAPMASGNRLILGHILTCEKHPESDHLHVLSVDCGKEGIRTIVCGAPNARADLNVIVALPGCALPALGKTIEKGVIRGIESDGMCCSLVELGVAKSLLSEKQIDGIEELPPDAPVGETSVLAYLGLDDTLLDINVLPNRPDCLSYFGIAREISSLTGAVLKPIPTLGTLPSLGRVKVTSQSKDCPRFSILRLISLVSKKETPKTIVRALEASGIRSLSPLLDFGNYLMLLTGQPVNLYDASANPSGSYTVRQDYQGKFVTFDGKEIDLISGDLVVCSEKGPLCLAGICAGKEGAVSDSSTTIDVEFADFYHAAIRHTANRLGLASASEALFAKGRNPKMIDEAIATALALLPVFFDSAVVSDASDYNVSAKENKPFLFSRERLNHRLGTDYTEAEVQKVLTAYRIHQEGDFLQAPIDRTDLSEQADIDEEVFRYYGAARVKPSLVSSPITQGALSDAQQKKRDIISLLIDRGFSQILSYTLIDEKEDQSIRVFSSAPGYRLVNPMTKDHEIVRSDLLPSMLSVIDYNLSHQNLNLKLFEVSAVDTPNGNHEYLSLALVGDDALVEGMKARPFDFFDLKGIIEAIFARLGLAPTRYKLDYSKNPAFHPTVSADIFFGKDLIGTFGHLHPSFSDKPLVIGEIDLGFLLNLASGKTRLVPIPDFPAVRRDLSFKMSDAVSYALLRKTILETKDAFLRSVSLFDDFCDKATGEHFLGVTLTLGKEDGTMKDNEITAAVDAVKSHVKSSLGLTLRGE